MNITQDNIDTENKQNAIIFGHEKLFRFNKNILFFYKSLYKKSRITRHLQDIFRNRMLNQIHQIHKLIVSKYVGNIDYI